MKQFLLLITLISVQFSFSQEFAFRSLNALPISSNAAFTGISSNPRLNYGIGVTNLWSDTYTLQNYASYDQSVKVLHGGVGAELIHGTMLGYQNSNTQFNLSYSFQQNLSENFSLSIGTRLELSQHRINVNEFYGLSNSIDSIQVTNRANYALSALVYSKKFFIGGIYAPFSYPTYWGEFETVNTYSGIIGYSLTPFKNKNISILGVVNYSYQDGFQTLTAQAAFNTKKVSFGSSVTARSYFTVFAGYQFGQFNFKAVTGINSSPLTSAKQTSQELIIQYKLPSLNNAVSKRFDLNLF